MAHRHIEMPRRMAGGVLSPIAGKPIVVVLTTAILTALLPVNVTFIGPTDARAAAATPLPASSEGRRLFLKLNCYGCHGMNGAGAMGPRLRGMDDDVSEIVRNGSDDGMPAFGRFVTTQDLTNLTAYIRSLGTRSEPVFTHWWEPYPSK